MDDSHAIYFTLPLTKTEPDQNFTTNNQQENSIKSLPYSLYEIYCHLLFDWVEHNQIKRINAKLMSNWVLLTSSEY